MSGETIANLHYLVTLSHEQAVRDMDAIGAAAKRVTKSMMADFIDATSEVNKFDKMLEQIARQTVRGTATPEGIKKLQQMMEHYRGLNQSDPAVMQRMDIASSGVNLHNARQLPMHPADAQKEADDYLSQIRAKAEAEEAVRVRSAQDRSDAANAAAHHDRQRELQRVFDDDAEARMSRERANKQIANAPGLPIFGDSNILRHDQQFQREADVELNRDSDAQRRQREQQQSESEKRLRDANAAAHHDKQRELQRTFDDDAERQAESNRIRGTQLPVMGGTNVAAQARQQLEMQAAQDAQRRRSMVEEHQFYNRNGGLREVIPQGPMPIPSNMDMYGSRPRPTQPDPVLSRVSNVQGSDPYSMNLARTSTDNLADQHAHFQRLAREGKNVEVQLEKINREFNKRDPYVQGLKDKIRELKRLEKAGQDTSTEISRLQKKLSQTESTDSVGSRMDNEGLGSRGSGRGSRGRQTRFAMSNIAFGVEDFAISYQMAGLEAGLRASANNISAIIASVAKTTSGMMMGIVGATGAAIAIPMLMNYMESLSKAEEKVEDRTRRLNNEFERMSKAVMSTAGTNRMWEEGDIKGLRNKEKSNRDDIDTTETKLGIVNNELAALRKQEAELKAATTVVPNNPGAQGHGGVHNTGQFPADQNANLKKLDGVQADIKIKEGQRKSLYEDLTGQKLEGDKLKGMNLDALEKNFDKFMMDRDLGRRRFESKNSMIEEMQDRPMTGDELRARMKIQRDAEITELSKNSPFKGVQLDKEKEKISNHWEKMGITEGGAQDIRRENWDERKAKMQKESAERLERDLMGTVDKRKAIEMAHVKRLEDINKNETLSPERKKELEELSKKAMGVDLGGLDQGTHPDLSAIKIGTAEDIAYQNRVSTGGQEMEVVVKAVEAQGAATVTALKDVKKELENVVKLLKVGTI